MALGTEHTPAYLPAQHTLMNVKAGLASQFTSNGGKWRIRTSEPPFGGCRFSKPVVSASHPTFLKIFYLNPALTVEGH